MVGLNSDFLQSPVVLAHHFLAGAVPRGGVAIDATAGNGHDTLFLAGLVGAGGRVYAFDIQSAALEKTKKRLAQAGVEAEIRLVLAGHETMGSFVQEKVDAIMFNLGYLPGGDHALVTRPETTLAALEQGLELLKPGGFISLVIYPGHCGGKEEGQRVENWLAGLPKAQYQVLKITYLNRSAAAPCLVLVEKALTGGDKQNESPKAG